MNIFQRIDQNYRSHGYLRMAEECVNSPRDIIQLVDVAISDHKHPYPEFASWVMIHISKKKPDLLYQFETSIIDCIIRSSNQSVLRNLVHTSLQIPLSDYRETDFLERLIGFLRDDSNKIALQVYALYKLIHFVEKYPEIHFEVESILQLKPNEIKPAMRIATRNYSKEIKSLL